MLIWALIVLTAALIGLAVKVVLDRQESDYRISLMEGAIGLVVITVLIAPLTVYFGAKLAIDNVVRYNEFYGGYELSAEAVAINCDRTGRFDGDNGCQHRYDCDSYTELEPYTEQVSDGNGKSHSETKYRLVTKQHHCPYASRETTYIIHSTLGDYNIADHIFDESPTEWRKGSGIPNNVSRGIPPFWQAAHDRIAAGDPGPVTQVREYDNYILASTNTILHKFSGSVQRYRGQNLLPPPSANPGDPIRDFYYATKLFFVGNGGLQHPTDESAWEFCLNRFNAALGTSLQGDMHVVIADASVITDPDDYAGALNAWWQDPSWGRNALSKNGIGVVIGARSGTIEWARAFTGMPAGNDALLVDIRNKLKGIKLDSQVLFGHPKGQINGEKVSVASGDGALEQIIWGEHQFQRVHMNTYDYLKGEIEPTAGQKWAIWVIGVLLSSLIWVAFVFTFIGEKTIRPAGSFIRTRTSNFRDRYGWS